MIRLRALFLLVLFLNTSVLPSTQAWALPVEEVEIPTTPSENPQLGKEIPTVNPYRCQRIVLYRNKAIECDSYHLQDGEKLRSIFMNDPPVLPAIDELNIYQENRKSIRSVAYWTTAGIVLGVVGFFFIAPAIYDEKSHKAELVPLRNIMAFVGAGVAVGFATYGFVHLRNNERHLDMAIEKYNLERPEDPIVIQFSKTFELF